MHGTLHKWLQFGGPKRRKRRGDGLASRHNCRRSIEVVRNGVRAQRSSDGVDFFHFSNPTGKTRLRFAQNHRLAIAQFTRKRR